MFVWKSYTLFQIANYILRLKARKKPFSRFSFWRETECKTFISFVQLKVTTAKVELGCIFVFRLSSSFFSLSHRGNKTPDVEICKRQNSNWFLQFIRRHPTNLLFVQEYSKTNLCFFQSPYLQITIETLIGFQIIFFFTLIVNFSFQNAIWNIPRMHFVTIK